MVYSTIIILIGLLSSFILFYRFPILEAKTSNNSQYNLSIIIPTRNEEKNISLLLKDLLSQNIKIHEIICVDDGSNDKTIEVASLFGVKIISITNKPVNWTGKAWACQTGADFATGDILLFLDSDVRLNQNAISTLLNVYEEKKCVLSVQPYHNTEKYFEQFSFFFNLIEIAGNGTSVFGKPKIAGLYGPVILIDQKTYNSIGKHSAAQKSIVDDMALGERLNQKGLSFKVFTGLNTISFRMYGNNFNSLYQGWVKNYATGASKTEPLVFGLIFLWITSSLSTVIFFIQSLLSLNLATILLAIFFYLLWIFEFSRLSKAVGRFKKTTIIFYPIYLIFFISIFAISFFKKILDIEVTWKGRKIKLEE